MTRQAALLRCLLISNFNIENLAGYLTNDESPPRLQVDVAPLGDVMSTLLDAAAPLWSEAYDAAVLWTRPEAVVESFRAVLEFRRAPLEQTLAEVDQYAVALLALGDRVKSVLVPSWVLPPWHRGLGLLDWREGGTAWTLAQMNLRLAQRLAEAANFHLLDAQQWAGQLNAAAFSAQLWYLGKIPFTQPLFKLAATEIKAALAALAGDARKLIVLDLDDTLWGGIVGDAGWQSLRLGGHDAIGEAFVDFQRGLKALQNRGIVLAIVSKNDESVALEAIRENPAMILRLDDFAGWRINWNDKAENLVDLARELNLGLDSIVFIDDSPAERERIREALPEVLVPRWPAEKLLYPQALASLRCFDSPAQTAEDQGRTATYAAERERRGLQHAVGSVEQWLEKLGLRVRIEPLTAETLKRTVQLLNKTHQMNLATRRMTESEYQRWTDADHRRVWCFQVSDRFGDYGLTGLTSVQWNGAEGRIVDFVLSCRVFGRRIEQLMTAFAIGQLADRGIRRLTATYVPSGKNQVCGDFWKLSGFAEDAPGVFGWDTAQSYAPPPFISVETSLVLR